NGGIYSLTFSNQVSGAVNDTVDATLSVNAAGFNAGPINATWIAEVAVKVSSSLNVASLLSAPSGVANWTLLTRGVDANGCSGSGSGFICANYVGPGQGVAINAGVLNWTFHLTIPHGSLDASPADTIKVRYVDSTGTKVGSLVSEDVVGSSAPEPS